MGGFAGRIVHAQDDLALFLRDYGAPGSRKLPVFCLSGLTRNSKDYDRLALDVVARHGRRVLAMDYRGRGRSAYDPDWRHYDVPTYAGDVLQVLAALHVPRAVFLGTSLGGLVIMALAGMHPTALAAVILNDIGPTVDEAGRQRIAGYVGIDARPPDFETAAAALRESYQRAFPKFGPEQWLRMARSTYVEDSTRGGLRLDYDLAISKVLRKSAEGPLPDLWPLFRGLRDLPVLALRGALSDILDAGTLARMQAEHPGMAAVTVPDVGHAPELDEPQSLSSIDAFLERLP